MNVPSTMQEYWKIFLRFLKDSPDTNKVLYGYRQFRLNNRKLYSLTRSYIWEPEIISEAKCSGVESKNSIHIDNRYCECGLYAYSSLENLFFDREFKNVIGRVCMWGKIVEHDTGYRSQFAYPDGLYRLDKAKLTSRASKSIAVYYKNNETISDLCANYGIEIFEFPDKFYDLLNQQGGMFFPR